MTNPFELVTASKLDAPTAVELWCDDSRLDRIKGGESWFIHGNRGTGKSMLFRVLQRDCQDLLAPNRKTDFLAIYFAVRDSDLMAEEFALIEHNPQRMALSESHMVVLIVRQLLLELIRAKDMVPRVIREPFLRLVVERLAIAYQFSDQDRPDIPIGDWDDTLRAVAHVVELEAARLLNHVQRQLFRGDSGYDGPLFLFDSLIGPIGDFLLEKIGCPLFVLVDDGDDLPRAHTIVLNTWIARRRASVVFKVSTMFAYKTYETRSGSKIQSPHDFIEYNIASRFLDYSSEDYVDLVRRICEKRMAQADLRDQDGNVVSDARVFFAPDVEQDARLEELRAELTAAYRDRYEGRDIGDHVYRHLTSEYMKRLNLRHSLGSYRYAGFETLAILSGGIVRDFIVCAQRMYDDASRRRSNGITSISPAIQNEVVRDHASAVVQGIDDVRGKRSGNEEEWRLISQMVNGLGNLFKRKMLSDDSERRVFSFALQSRPDEDMRRLLDLAVGEGYLVRGFISKKEGTGRRYLYVLTRRLAPAFSLDVSAYNGYLSLEPVTLMKLAHAETVTRQPTAAEGQMELRFSPMPRDGDWAFADPDGREVW